jgi:diguanylate cyclase (GGDEF)-like protein/PAS domain S-box-containing protein
VNTYTKPLPVDTLFADSNAWLWAAFQHLPGAVFVFVDEQLGFANQVALGLIGAREISEIAGFSLATLFHDKLLSNSASLLPHHLQTTHNGQARLLQCRTLQGAVLDVEVRSNHFLDHGKNILCLSAQTPLTPTVLAVPSTTTRNRSEETLLHEKEILEMLALHKPLRVILKDVCERMERVLGNDSVCAIMLFDHVTRQLHLGAAPHLPAELQHELAHVQVSMHSGSGAMAIYSNSTVVVEDIGASSIWDQHRQAALDAGMQSCWSMPIRTAFGSVLGTIDLYHAQARIPSIEEQTSIANALGFIGLAIDKKHMEQSLEQSEERYRSVVTNLTEGIMVIAPGGRILTCNPSAKRILKIENVSAVGRRHRYFKRIMNEDGSERRLGEDPASVVFRSGVPILNLSLAVELRDGSVVWLLVNVMPIRNGTTITSAVVSFTDTTEVRETQRQLQYIASHDALTGLPNRHQLTARLTQALHNARQNGHKVAVLFLDLDRFKNVNDTAGHSAGDALLRDVALRLGTCIRTTDMLARLGGDEFVVVAEAFEEQVHLKELAERLLARMREPFVIEDNEYHLGTSVGIAAFPKDADDGATLLRCADSAMYYAKELGRNNYQFFTAELNIRAQHRYTLETNLRRALADSEFLVFYQAKVSLTDNKIVGAEALIRWEMPGKGLIMPSEFIAISEELGLILPIGRWMIEQVCKHTKKWRDTIAPDLVVSVNISPRQFQDPGLAKFIQQALEDTGLPGHALQLEITEGLLMSDAELLLPVFAAIKRLGVSISLDDFGTGFSSLSYLQRFPIDNLKIDRSFICGIPEKQDSVVLSRAIIAMASALGVSVTAEGVENTAQMDFLKGSGCQEMQGNYFSKPVPRAEYETLLVLHSR